LAWALGIILITLFLDQSTKIYIKLNYPLSGYGVPPIIDWGFFKLLFVENKGISPYFVLLQFLVWVTGFGIQLRNKAEHY